jgi:DNA-binding MarR family transcriptional regulator
LRLKLSPPQVPSSSSPRSAGPPAPRLDPADFQSLGEFRRAIREFLAFSEESAHEKGVTAQQHQALLAIKAHAGPEPMSIGELADALLIKNHSAVGLVARLIERGLVQRRASEADRRRVLLTLDPRGDEVLTQISIINIQKLAGSAKSLRRVLATLKKLETAQSAKAEPPGPAEG